MPFLHRTRVIGLLWSAGAAAFVAGYLVPYKIAAAEVGPEGFVLPMLLCAALINTAIDTTRHWGSSQAAPWRWDRLTAVVALLLGASSALGNEAACRALVWIDPGLVSVSLRTQVIFVALGGMLLLGERVSLRFWFGAGVVIGGFALLGWVHGMERGISMTGVAWAVTAAAGFAVMQVVVRRTITRINPLQVNTLRLWLAVLLLLLLPGRLAPVAELDLRLWLLAGTAALFGPVLSRLCLMQALRYLPAAYATLALFVAPLFAYGLAGLVLGSWPGYLELAGGALILLGVALPIFEIARAPAVPAESS